MGTTYLQLSIEDRCRIASLQEQGCSIRQIAAALDRAPSTVAREVKRNTGRKVGYRPAYAHEQTRARRWKGSKLERDHSLRRLVLDRLGQGWSPEQVAGRLAREQAKPSVSHETIYRFIYAQIARTKNYSWRTYLPRSKSKRGCRGRKGGSSTSFIEGRIPLSERPTEASDRQTPGHWEADLMMFAKYGQAILTIHERSSRILLAARPDNKTANLTAELIEQLLRPIPSQLRRTMTFDNGTRVRSSHPPTQPRSQDLLLRSLRPLAKRRNRERHRQNATPHPTQNRPRHPLRSPLHSPRPGLQRHPQKVPRLQNSRRAIPPTPVALGM
jgi:transposase, IS30 family